MPDRTCPIEGCNRMLKRRAICDMHYFRRYRHGSVHANYTEQAVRTSKGRRYKRINCPGHYLAGANNQQWEHRVVLFDTIGMGPHPCHWCGKPLDWGGKTKDSLVVDHLDGYGDNNEPANLMPSCLRCNSSRAIKEKCDANEGRWWNGEGADAVRRTLPPRKT